MLDDRRLKVIEYLVEGVETRTKIDRGVGISRQTLYDWMKEDEFATELDNCLQSIKSFAEKKVESHKEFAINNLIEMAADKSNRRVQAQVNQYLR